ncbi:Meiotically up-regulated gene 113 [Glycomyces sambucus]|uniref:Meiotically up-regulated gene 113 n=1 Tax=Glycomyces sambucus TaxID=380244 RepID=A0A1G9MWE8_9ACTN|nr:DUF4041 domain-containing protein [Glycomyces sambucus]SDL78590.1 Meiotically up-regulated gene 113 [Glycomyces sambucus]
MAHRFNTPPGWPVAPDWTPPQHWQPPPDWPHPPQDWQWWVEVPEAPAAPPVPAVPAQPLPAAPASDVNPDLLHLLATPVTAVAQSTNGRGNRKAQLESQVEALTGFAERLQRALTSTVGELRVLGALDAAELTVEIGRRKAMIEHLESTAEAHKASVAAGAEAHLRQVVDQATAANAELQRLGIELDRQRAALVETRDTELLQEVGVYEYSHPLSDAVAFKAQLETIRDRYKVLAKNDRAITCIANWHVNGSLAQGRKMVREFSKLMLRAYNAEADNLVRTMRPYKVDSSVSRLGKTRETIMRLGSTMEMRISDEYHWLRVDELKLTADYLAKVAEEKERIREQRAKEREEEKAQKEMQRETEKLEKERAHIQAAMAKLADKGDLDAVEALKAQLESVDAAFANVMARQANSSIGHVYVISNIGAFGPNMVKIGMTRRLEPLDRVNELGDASVPFRFDVHAMIYSENAPKLEAKLHEVFAEFRVNRVNQRREFFYVSPEQVRDELAKLEGEHLLEYTDHPEAYEWRASGGEHR